MREHLETVFYDADILENARRHGIKQGIEWMRERIMKMLLANPDMDPTCEFYAGCVKDIDAEDFFKKPRE